MKRFGEMRVYAGIPWLAYVKNLKINERSTQEIVILLNKIKM